MGSKTKTTLLIIPLAMFLFICSEVTARDFQEGMVVQEANEGDAKLLGGGGFFPGGGFGDGFGGGDFFPGRGFLPGRGFNPRFCRFGCCFGDPFRGCFRCCPIF